jgi:hypothetical protein
MVEEQYMMHVVASARVNAGGSIAGKSCGVRCTPFYAQLEAMQALPPGLLTVEPSFGMCSIAIIVYESLAGCQGFCPHSALEQGY